MPPLTTRNKVKQRLSLMWRRKIVRIISKIKDEGYELLIKMKQSFCVLSFRVIEYFI